mmetsp:Transcript_127321/g.179701  ORF Transcript_127321/g.179701 Transcript_127321/m.179701 type:complete len:387 (-) Transcript_127321:32-1192(-)
MLSRCLPRCARAFAKPLTPVQSIAASDAALKGAKRKVLSDRSACDVELLCAGAFSPTNSFLTQEEYTSCVETMRLPNNEILGLPVVLDSNGEENVGDVVVLEHQGQAIAALTVTSKYKPFKEKECKEVYGTTSVEHPAVRVVFGRGEYYLGGTLNFIAKPQRNYAAPTPTEIRASLPESGPVVGFQCRNPIHKAHYHVFMNALNSVDTDGNATLLIHPTVGPTQEDDIDGETRILTYEALMKEIGTDKRLRCAYLPYSMHMAGPREAIQHMIVRRAFGCTHFVIGRDMAGSKSSLDSEDFYGAYEAQEMAKKHSAELGIGTIESLNLVYTEEEGYITADAAEAKGLKKKKLSGTEFRRRMRAGEDIPEWFAFPQVVSVLRPHMHVQ